MNLKTYKAISGLNRAGVLWHGLSAERALEALQNGFIKPHSVQRFWSDGMFYSDDQPEYDSSYWANGWCMSRDKLVAEKFAARGVLFAFNARAIKETFQVVPYSWAGAIPRSTAKTRKSEREEYVLSGGICESEAFYQAKSDEIQAQIAQVNAQRKAKVISLAEKKKRVAELEALAKVNTFNHHFYQPHGRNMPLANAFGFFITEKRPNEAVCAELEKHPLFLGYL